MSVQMSLKHNSTLTEETLHTCSIEHEDVQKAVNLGLNYFKGDNSREIICSRGKGEVYAFVSIWLLVHV